MKNLRLYLFAIILSALIAGLYAFTVNNNQDSRFISYVVNPATQNLQRYYKNDKQQSFGSIGNLKNWLEKKHLTLNFAMNGGMYKKDGSPQGLFIQQGKTIAAIDTASGNGNFYLKPNGVFYLDAHNIPHISTTPQFTNNAAIKYATQSGPMLVINGKLHDAFKEGSTNLQIRNGVGILPGNKVVFAMSKEPINFYDFAQYFKGLGCNNALYLDGFVSRTYLPEQNWVQTDGNLGVIIGVTSK